jgi:hypothetical protein
LKASASGRVDEWKRVRDGYWESGGKLEELRDQGALVTASGSWKLKGCEWSPREAGGEML